MLVLPNRLLWCVLSTSDQDVVSSLPNLSSPYTDEKNPFHGVRLSIPNLDFPPRHVSVRFSQITFPETVLLKDARTNSFQEERLGLPYWTMISTICVVVDISKSLDIPILEFSIICEHLPLSLGYKLILRLLLVHRNQAIWSNIHDLGGCHLRCWWSWFKEHCVRSRINFYNITAENNSTIVFMVFCLQFIIFHMKDVHLWWKMNFFARHPCFIDHLFLTFDFRQVPRRNFFQFFPFLVHRCFRCWNLHSLRHRNKLVHQIAMQWWIVFFSCNMVFVNWRFRIPHTHSGGFIGFQNTRKFCRVLVRSATPTILHNFTGQSRSNWRFQFLTCVLDGFLEFLILGVDKINSTQFSCVVKMNLFFRPFFFSFSLAFFPIDFHNSGHRWSGLDVSCFHVNLPPDQVYPSRAFSSSRVNCVKPVQRSDKSREPSMFQ